MAEQAERRPLVQTQLPWPVSEMKRVWPPKNADHEVKE